MKIPGFLMTSARRVRRISHSRGAVIMLTHSLAALFLMLAGGLTIPCRASTLYVSNIGDSTIEQFTSGGVGSAFANTGVSAPYGLAFDSVGNLYEADNGTNTIQKFTPGGVGSVFASTGLNEPTGIAFDNAGNLYVANYA